MSDKSASVVYRFAVGRAGRHGRFETRHAAVGKAAIVNRDRDDRRRDLPVRAFAECGCDVSMETLDHSDRCGRCGEVIA